MYAALSYLYRRPSAPADTAAQQQHLYQGTHDCSPCAIYRRIRECPRVRKLKTESKKYYSQQRARSASASGGGGGGGGGSSSSSSRNDLLSGKEPMVDALVYEPIPYRSALALGTAAPMLHSCMHTMCSCCHLGIAR